MYKVKGYIDNIKVFNASMAHLPRVGDKVYIGPDKDFGIVKSIIWDMKILSTDREHEWTTQIINLYMVSSSQEQGA